jgi:ribokinase
MMLDVIGFGALNMDKLYRVKRIAGADEESFITGYTEAPGGSAANTLVGLARLHMNTGCIGKLAQDREGRHLLQDLVNEGVDVQGVTISTEGRSGVVLCFVDESGERAMYVNPGVNNDLTLNEIDVEHCRNTKFVHVTSFIGEKAFEVQKELLKDLTRVRVSFDPGMHYAAKGFQALKPILTKSYIVFPNESELKLLTGEDYEKGARALIAEGIQIVAVKLGKKGCYVTNGVEKHLIDAYQVNVIDTTGAGDAFCAGFLYGLLTGKDLYTCGRLGNYVASRKIGEKGARQGLPYQADLPSPLG